MFLPTYSSWLNWIEAEFTAVRYFALNGTDHHTHAEQDVAIAAYIRWRNARARPKTGFATDSPDSRLDPLLDQSCATQHLVRAAGATGQCIRACAPVRWFGASRGGGSAPVR